MRLSTRTQFPGPVVSITTGEAMAVVIGFRRIGGERHRRQHPEAGAVQARIGHHHASRRRAGAPGGMDVPLRRGIAQRHLGPQPEARQALRQAGRALSVRLGATTSSDTAADPTPSSD